MVSMVPIIMTVASFNVLAESVLGYSLINSKFFNSHYNLQMYSQVELKEQVRVHDLS